LVSEDAIREAMLFLLEKANVLVEPSGAASLAGLLMNTKRAGPSVAILSGGNITLQQLDKHRGLDPSQNAPMGPARSKPA
jgi:threonine dehydratase